MNVWGSMPVSSLEFYRATCMHAGRGVALRSSSWEQASRVLVNSESESKEWCGCQEKGCLAAFTEIECLVWFSASGMHQNHLWGFFSPKCGQPPPPIWLCSSLRGGGVRTKHVNFGNGTRCRPLIFFKIDLDQGRGLLRRFNVKRSTGWKW